jgi:hypothetical protein
MYFLDWNSEIQPSSIHVTALHLAKLADMTGALPALMQVHVVRMCPICGALWERFGGIQAQQQDVYYVSNSITNGVCRSLLHVVSEGQKKCSRTKYEMHQEKLMVKAQHNQVSIIGPIIS